jgi:hypothetical protein
MNYLIWPVSLIGILRSCNKTYPVACCVVA